MSTEKTKTDQLTQMGRARLIRGKQTTAPAFLDVRPFDDNVAERLRGENPYRLSAAAAGADVQRKHDYSSGCSSAAASPSGEVLDDFSLIGFRRSSGQSLLGRLGVSVLASRNESIN